MYNIAWSSHKNFPRLSSMLIRSAKPPSFNNQQMTPSACQTWVWPRDVPCHRLFQAKIGTRFALTAPSDPVPTPQHSQWRAVSPRSLRHHSITPRGTPIPLSWRNQKCMARPMHPMTLLGHCPKPPKGPRDRCRLIFGLRGRLCPLPQLIIVLHSRRTPKTLHREP
jgi:hypothetical protein